MTEEPNPLFDKYAKHMGHSLVCVCYDKKKLLNIQELVRFEPKREPLGPPAHISIECETCSEVLLDFDKPEPDRRKGARSMEKDATYHLGPNQRQILGILRAEPHLTLLEIATLLYDTPVKAQSYRYIATSRSISELVKRGLVEKQEVTYNLSAGGRLAKKPKWRNLQGKRALSIR